MFPIFGLAVEEREERDIADIHFAKDKLEDAFVADAVTGVWIGGLFAHDVEIPVEVFVDAAALDVEFVHARSE